MQPPGFNADPVTSKPLQRLRASDAIGHSSNDGFGVSQGLGNQLYLSGGNQMHGGSHPGCSPSPLLQPFQGMQDSYQGAPLQQQPPPQQQQQQQPNQLHQMLEQQKLLNQLQSQLASQAQIGTTQQNSLHSLLQAQMQGPASGAEGSRMRVSEPAQSFNSGHQGLPALWPPVQNARSPPTVGSSMSSPALNDFQGLKHPAYSVPEEKKHGRTHGPSHGSKSRPADSDSGQAAAVEKLRREAGRLHAELERLDREIGRQKALRETERIEFTDAKDRLKHSWAADREDFARVKTLLKNKNAEHHAQSGRLSQQLKEIEGVNRGLRDLCARNGVVVPAELENTHSRHQAPPVGQPTAASATSSHMSISSSSAMSSMTIASTNPSSQLSSTTTRDASMTASREQQLQTPSELERVDRRLGGGGGGGGGAKPPDSPSSAAGAFMSMVQRLPGLLQKEQPGNDAEKSGSEGETASAARAAAQAADALGQLAAALKSPQPPNSRPATPVPESTSPLSRGLSLAIKEDIREEEMEEEDSSEPTDLQRMSLASWVPHADKLHSHTPSSSRPPSTQPSGHTPRLRDQESASEDDGEEAPAGVGFGSNSSKEATPFERAAQEPLSHEDA